MRVFISYASEDRNSAEQIHLALVGAGIQSFFDRGTLPPGGDFSARIRAGVDASDLFVFLISPESITKGSYALTELQYARLKWPHPKGRVLPVMARYVEFQQVPAYLGSVTVLEPEGNLVAEVILAISAMTDSLKPKRRRFVATLVGVALVLVVVAWAVYRLVPHREPEPVVNNIALTDQEPAGGGVLVDVDPLTVTWQGHGQPEDVRVSLESLQGALRTDDIRASSSEGLVRFPPESYRKLLATRQKGASNRLRAIIRSRTDTYTSQPAEVRVGLQVLTLADIGGVTVAAMIDNQRVANYDFETLVVVPAATPAGDPLRIGPNIPYRFTAVRVRRPADYDWSAIKAVYLGPDDLRVVRLAYLVDGALNQNRSLNPKSSQIARLDREISTRVEAFTRTLEDASVLRFSKAGLVDQLVGTHSSISLHKDLGEQSLPALLADLQAAVPEGEKSAIRKVQERLLGLPGAVRSEPVDETFLADFRRIINDELRLPRWQH